VRSRDEKPRAQYQRQPATKSCAQRQKKAEGEPADDDLSSEAAKGQHCEVGIEPLDQEARAGWTREDSGLSSAGGGCHEEDNNIRKVEFFFPTPGFFRYLTKAFLCITTTT
jgi:hypothetical protein